MTRPLGDVTQPSRRRAWEASGCQIVGVGCWVTLIAAPGWCGNSQTGPFEHNDFCATLEDWFDERLLRADYVPTGWRGPPGTKTRAVKGHEYGLDLSDEDRKGLIAFLRTL